MTTIKAKAARMRRAIEGIELALHGAEELVGLPEKWGDPKLAPHVTTTVTLNVGQVYLIHDALRELIRITNDPEFNFHNFK
jgi:hypothetical protein